MNLLIVDDEPFVVDWLYSLIEEKLPDLEVFKTYSAVQAVGILERIRMDIVVCDIRMPGMSGLELMDYLLPRWPRCRVIFLTGYSEFDYVYHAIQSPGVRYLLKTESDETIIGSIISEIDELKAERKKQDNIDELHEYANRLLLSDRYLHAILSGEHFDFAELEKIGFDGYTPFFFVFGRFSERHFSTDHLFKCAVAIEHCLGFHFRSLQYAITPDTYLWMLQPKKTYQEDDIKILAGYLDELQGILSEGKIHSVRIYWKEKPIIPAMISLELPRFVYEANCQNVPENAIISDVSMGALHQNRDSTLSSIDLRMRIGRVSDIEQILTLGDAKAYGETLENITSGLDNVANRYDTACTQIFMSVALVLLKYIAEHGQESEISENINLRSLRSPDNFATWNSAFDYLLRIGIECINITKIDQDNQQKGVINQLLTYIDKHLNADLSLATLSDILHYNPCYLSQIFKKETGKNLSAYINDARIQRACKLLKDTNISLAEISEQCGYTSVQYFITVFRRITFMSPKIYREKMSRTE